MHVRGVLRIKKRIKKEGQMGRPECQSETPGYARYSGYDTREEEDEFLSILGPVWCDGDPMPVSELDDHAVSAKRGKTNGRCD
jgi:hypothetical protein